MTSDFAIAELVLLGGGVVVAATIAGLLAGFLGVGGGIVLVPTLFWLFTFIEFAPELSVHMAVATSLATIIFTSISSAKTHHEKGAVDFDLLKVWAPLMAFGALMGGLASRYIDPNIMKLIFAIFAFLVALNLATSKTVVFSKTLPKSRFFNHLISFVTGVLSSLMGIGGGTLSVPILSAFSYPIKKAVGTASAFGLVISVPAVIGFIIAGWDFDGLPPLSLGYVNLAAVLVIIPFTTFMAPFGARFAHYVDGRWVKRGFALFLIITALRMFYSAI